MWAVSLALQPTTWERAPGAFDGTEIGPRAVLDALEKKKTLAPNQKVT